MHFSASLLDFGSSSWHSSFSTLWLARKIFEKAGQPGWASIVPFYNSYIRYKIFWGNGWLFFVPIVCTVLGGIPLLGTLLVIVGVIINIVTLYKQSVAFGQGIASPLACSS